MTGGAPPVELLVATKNPGKVREIAAVLTGLAVRLRSLVELSPDWPEPVEDQPTFRGNAEKKARHYATRWQGLVLAEDSGLVVDALDGAPGVRSARYSLDPPAPPGGAPAPDAGRDAIDRANNAKLVAALAGVPPEQRTARFRCVAVLADPTGVREVAEGTIEGRILDTPRGEGGFGYDPHFWVPSLGCTTAELSAEHKNRISHRGQALRGLRARLVERLR